MIPSAISFSHFFYLVFLESDQIKRIDDLIKLFPDYNSGHKEQIEEESLAGTYYHLQLEIGKMLGTESVLLLNKSNLINSRQYFWYDFYVGEIFDGSKNTFFICYPYIKLGTYIDDFLLFHKIRRRILKPSVDEVLKHIQNNLAGENEDTGNPELTVEISKYSAEVKEDTANRINISGKNPLNSRVYQLLSNDDKISIEPLSLRLNCRTESNTLDLSFDKLGNLRFWLKRNGTGDLVAIVSKSLIYLKGIDAFYESSFISKFTILEDEQ